MPASTLPDVTKNPTLNNGQKETTIEKESIKDIIRFNTIRMRVTQAK
jgi:hypothetical protein